MDVEAEIRDLKRRVGELEGSFGFLTEQVKAVHRSVLAFEARTEQRFERLESNVERLESKVERLESKVDGLDRKFDGLVEALPKIVGEAVREANRERDKKR